MSVRCCRPNHYAGCQDLRRSTNAYDNQMILYMTKATAVQSLLRVERLPRTFQPSAFANLRQLLFASHRVFEHCNEDDKQGTNRVYARNVVELRPLATKIDWDVHRQRGTT